MVRWIAICIAVGIAASAACAQDTPVSSIETQGVAVVEATPSYVDFWIHQAVTAATLVEAAEQTLRFENSIRKGLQAAELTAAELAFSGMAIPDLAVKEARVSVRMRFTLPAMGTPEDACRNLAGLCDKIAALAAPLTGAKPEGPFLGVDDKESVEESAVGRATEKAYPAGKAVALAMAGQIHAVDRVTVESITWNNSPDIRGIQPDIRRLTCTAKVKIRYAFAP